MSRPLTAVIERVGDGYVALCPELDIASQGKTAAESRENLKKELASFLDTASVDEIKIRLREEKGNVDTQDRLDPG